MDDFTKRKTADMHLTYGVANGNGRSVLWLYQKRFPCRYIPNRKRLQRIHRRQCKKGSFTTSTDGRGRSRTIWLQNLEEVILDHVHETSERSTTAVRQTPQRCY
ncbi:hypothetical protein TNCV_3046001 [Trichonephila clavipes]|uniref:Uncharacterized protein n=1 Tax=Trichonephila clavipes TaxID=2585209 RepID=A0A8X6V585_TRICX|nr:hypothetical protein TNCV_3046001 [Trichonephila clavipes]